MLARRFSAPAALLVVALLLVLLSSSALAQRKSPPRILLKDVEINQVKTPDFQDDSHPKASNDGEWLQIVIPFSSAGGVDGWLDNVTFDWSVLLLEGTTKRLLMHRSVTYLDVENERRDHYAAVWIRPRTLRRYYGETRRVSPRNILVHVAVKVDNVKVREQQFPADASKTGAPARWWSIDDPKVVTVVNRMLLMRPETPFAALNDDFWEVVKSDQR